MSDEDDATLLQKEHNRQLAMAYACGRLRSAVEQQLEWLRSTSKQLSERGITSERRRAICEKQARRLEAVLNEIDDRKE